MISFSPLTNKNRDARRPPRAVTIASPEIIAGFFPVLRKQRRLNTKKLPVTTGSAKGEAVTPRITSPLPQPTTIIHFPTVSNKQVGLAINGYGKYSYDKRKGAEEKIPQEGMPEKLYKRKEEFNSPDHIEDEQPDITQDELDQKEQPGQIDEEITVKPRQDLRKPAVAGRISETQPVPVTPKLRLKEVLAQHKTLPAQALVLGICEDELPLAVDLNDPTSGSLLVIGDNREDHIGLLMTAISSLSSRNSPREFQFAIFSHQPDAWHSWVSENGFIRHCVAIDHANENNIGEWIVRFAIWAEERRLGQRNGPPILLVIDTLAFLPRLEYDIRLNFDWLVKEGPSVRLWTISTVSTDLATSIGSRMLRPFHSRVFGYARDPGSYAFLMDLDGEVVNGMDQPGTYAVQTGNAWLRFQIPSFPT